MGGDTGEPDGDADDEVRRRTFPGSAPETIEPATAPAIDGRVIRRTRFHSTRPARTWALPAVTAATADTPMFAAGASGRRGRDQEQRGQPDVAEHEPGEAACHGGGEAPDRDGREREHVHPIEYPS